MVDGEQTRERRYTALFADRVTTWASISISLGSKNRPGYNIPSSGGKLP